MASPKDQQSLDPSRLIPYSALKSIIQNFKQNPTEFFGYIFMGKSKFKDLFKSYSKTFNLSDLWVYLLGD